MTLQDIITLVEDGRLGTALMELENYLLTYQQPADMEKLRALTDEYRLLTDYWARGYDDPHRTLLYRQLLRRLYVLVANMMLNDRLRHSPYLKNLYSRPRHSERQWSLEAIRQQMETFVASQAMLELEPEHVRPAKGQQLYADHATLMNDLFDYIITSRLWSDRMAEAFEQMLLSPTIDVLDQQLIVSAITLSAMQAFGFNKFSVLAKVYQQTDNAQLRQRALVGWTLVADERKLGLYPEMRTMVESLCSDEQTLGELTELQMQLIYCMEAENDGDKIKNEIIPDLMKGNNIRLTRQGLEEIDEDTLEDILHPEAAEQNMERMEQSMHRMADMQKRGADIYFGGFSQMKRFPFFSSPGNWFLPFYQNHPAVSTIWQNTRGRRFLEIVTEVGAFCDSDKYSFVLAFEQVISRLPKSMLELVEQGEASPMPVGGAIAQEEQRQPAFIRRIYLQNLYRFFRLYAVRSEFADPFASASRYLFFANPIFRGTRLEERMTEVAAFLIKRRRKDEGAQVLKGVGEAHQGYQYYMLMARVSDDARPFYELAMKTDPTSEQALAGYARTCFSQQRYEEATLAYQQLAAGHPEKTAYQLSLAASLASQEKGAEAEPILFRLNYEHSDDLGVKRVLAWTLMADGKYEQAERMFAQLTEGDEARREDRVNHALCLWLMRRVAEAVVMFGRVGEPVAPLIEAEADFLRARGIDDVELQLMVDTV